MYCLKKRKYHQQLLLWELITPFKSVFTCWLWWCKFQGFGQANHSRTCEILKSHYHDYTVEWSNEGYWTPHLLLSNHRQNQLLLPCWEMRNSLVASFNFDASMFNSLMKFIYFPAMWSTILVWFTNVDINSEQILMWLCVCCNVFQLLESFSTAQDDQCKGFTYFQF